MDKLLSGRRVLVIEDEMLILMMIEDMLADLGCKSVAVASKIRPAIDLIEGQDFDTAMVDMNLNGEIVYPLAELLTAQKVPFIFVTGYAPRSVDARFTAIPILQKPVLQDELAAMLEQVLTGPRRTKAASGAAAE